MLATQYAITKEMKSNPKESSCKKVCSPQEGYCEKRQGGGTKKWL